MPRPGGRVFVGISGWRYGGWRGVFYPRDLPQRRELEYASRAFSSIEINGTFYSLQRPERFAAWYRETPPGFVFSVKGPRFITHMKKLGDVDRALANFLASGVFNLREKLGPFLWQLPPSFRFDADRLEAFFERLPRDTGSALALARRREPRMHGRSSLAIDANRAVRHAIEVRHESFLDEAFVALLRRQRIARTRPRARKARDVYCYFDNDAKVKAPVDAWALIEKLRAPRGSATRRASRRP